MNKAILIGNLGRDAELRHLPDGTANLEFSVATTEKWRSPSGEKKERTDWHRCSIFGKRAEALAQYLTKGTRVAVEGRIRVDSTEKDGVKRTFVSVRVDELELLGGGDRAHGGAPRQAPQTREQAQSSSSYDESFYGGAPSDDDLPF